MKRDWAIRDLITGQFIPAKSEEEARDWAKRFPQSYKLVSRISAGEWEEQK
jgi:hypothetical protein